MTATLIAVTMNMTRSTWSAVTSGAPERGVARSCDIEGPSYQRIGGVG